jgi:nucleoside-diphosphate-sugar epimerase
MIENAFAGRTTKISQPAHSRRQYVYVDDIVDALLLALNAKTLPRLAYNAAGDTSLTLSEVADVVRRIVPGVQVAFGDDPQGDQYKIREVDLSIAQKELGYYPKISLEEGIRRYARWLKEK